MSEAFDKKVTEFFRTYQDRGMEKWQGFFLSDHTSTLRKDRQQKAMTYPKKAEMSAGVVAWLDEAKRKTAEPAGAPKRDLRKRKPHIKVFTAFYKRQNDKL